MKISPLEFNKIYEVIAKDEWVFAEDRAYLERLHTGFMETQGDFKKVLKIKRLSLPMMILLHKECSLLHSLKDQILGNISEDEVSSLKHYRDSLLRAIKQELDTDGENLKAIGKAISNSEWMLEIICDLTKEIPWQVGRHFKKFCIEDENVRYKLAKIIFDADLGQFIVYFENLELKNDDHRFEFAILIAKKYPNLIAQYLKNFAIDNEERRFNLAKIVIKKDLGSFGKNYSNFQFHDKEMQEYFANLLFKDASAYLAKSFDQFDQFSEEKRIEYCDKLRKKNLWCLAKNFDKFHIASEEKRFEIAKKIARKIASLLAENLEKFDITDESKKIALSEIVFKKHAKALMWHFDKFKFTDPEIHSGYAKRLVEKDPVCLADHFEFFTIESEELRVEFLKKVLIKSKKAVAANFDKFNISDQKLCFELCKKIAEKHPAHLAEHIEKFGLINEEDRVEIAEIIAKKKPDVLAKYFDTFSITNERWRFVLAVLVAKKYPGKLIKYFKFFAISDEVKRYWLARYLQKKECSSLLEIYDQIAFEDEGKNYRIAKAAVKMNPLTFIKIFLKFNLNESRHVEFAEILVKVSPELLAYSFYKFILDREKKIEFALKIARSVPKSAANNIRHFVKDEEHHYELAKVIARNAPSAFTYNFKSFLISPEKHYDIANIVIGKSAEAFLIGFSNFKIPLYEQRLAFAKICVNKDPELLARRFKKFQIDKSLHYEFAKIIAETNSETLAYNFEQFIIEKEQQRFELAMIIAKNTRYSILENFNKFEITDEEKRFKILKVCVHKNSYKILENFEKYDIKDQDRRYELLKDIAHKQCGAVINHFERFQIHDEAKRFELVKILAMKSPYHVFEDFPKFNIQNSTYLFEIAKLLVLEYPSSIIKSMGMFEIDSKEKKYEIAKIFAKKRNGEYSLGCLAANFNKFQFDDPEIHNEFIQIFLDHNPCSLAKNIQSFLIENEERRFEIAKIIAEQDPKSLCNNFSDFKLPKERHFSLAKIVVKKEPEVFKAHLTKFHLENLNQCLEIAKSLAIKIKQNDLEEYFSLDDEDKKIEVLKYIAKKASKECIDIFALFMVSKEIHLLEIAKEFYLQKPKALVENITKLQVGNEKTRFEIAKFVMEQKPKHVIQNLVEFSLSAEHKLEIVKSLSSNPDLIFENIDNFEIDETFAFEMAKLLIDVDSVEFVENLNQFKILSVNELNDIALELLNRLSVHGDTDDVGAMLNRMQENREQKIMITWLSYMIENQVEGRPMSAKTFRALARLKHPKLRITMSDLYLCTVASDNKRHDCFLNIIQKFPEYKVLIEVALQALEVQGIEESEIQLFKKKITRKFHPSENRNILLIALKNFLDSKMWLKDKQKVFKKFIQAKNLIQELGAYNALISFNKESDLQKDKYAGNDVSIFHILKRVFRKNLELNENETDKFVSILNNYRKPDSFAHYLSCIMKLPPNDKHKLKKVFLEFIKSLIDGTFKSQRYAVMKSKHLRTVLINNPGLLTEWMKGETSKVTGGASSNNQFDLKDFIMQSFHDNHLNKEEFPILHSYLSDKKPAQNMPNDFQSLTIKLIESTVQEKMAIIHDLENVLTKLSPDSEFINDLQVLKQQYGGEEASLIDMTISDTDDAEDLFNCGSEVAGSCQRTNGNPRLNKALMGYVIDPKNRLITIKKRDSKIFGRAIFRLLWDDKNRCPVLFLERVYPKNLSSQYEQAIINFAIERAKKLNLPLLKASGGYEEYDSDIKSLCSVAPFEYSDSADRGYRGNGMTEGIYTITKSRVLYRPNCIQIGSFAS